MRNHTNSPMSSTLGRIALTLLMFVSIFSLSSCHKDDDAIAPSIENQLVGKWKGDVLYCPKIGFIDEFGETHWDVPTIKIGHEYTEEWVFDKDGTYHVYYNGNLKNEGSWKVSDETKLYLSNFIDTNVTFKVVNNTLEFEGDFSFGVLAKIK